MPPSTDPFDFGSYDPNAAQPSASDSPVAGPRPGFVTETTSFAASPSAVAGPPVLWLLVAAVCGLAAIALATAAANTVAFAMIGWVLGGPVAIGAIAWFSIQDTRERAKPFYSSAPSTKVYYGIALALALLGVLAAAFRIAAWAGRL